MACATANSFLLRGVMPHKLFGWPQILRATVPVVTSPDPRSTSGLGDINMFDLFLSKAGGVELGIGPQFTMDSATDKRGLVTYQHSSTAMTPGRHKTISRPSRS